MTTIFKTFFKPRANDYTTKQLMFSLKLCESESEVAHSCLTFVTPLTVAHQAPPSMGFSRQ